MFYADFIFNNWDILDTTSTITFDPPHRYPGFELIPMILAIAFILYLKRKKANLFFNS